MSDERKNPLTYFYRPSFFDCTTKTDAMQDINERGNKNPIKEFCVFGLTKGFLHAIIDKSCRGIAKR